MSNNEDPTKANQQEAASQDNLTESTKRSTEAQKKHNETISEALDYIKKKNQKTEESIELEMDYFRAVGDVNSARQKLLELEEHLTNSQAAYTAQGHEYIELLTKQGELTDDEIKQRDELQKSLGKEAKLIEKNTALTRKLNKAKKELGEIHGSDQKRVDNLSKAFESMTMGLIDMNKGAEHSVNKFGQLTTSFFNSVDGAQVLTESLGKVFNVGNIAAEIFDTVKDATIGMAVAFDGAAAQFSKTTGLAREYSSVLEKTQRAGSRFSVSAKDGGEAMSGLLANFSDFHKTAPAVQKDLTLNVAQLSKFGVSATESAKLMQNFNKIMGMSGKEAIETSKKIGMMGTKIGIATSKMLKDYTASLKTLAVYGDKSIDVFTGIAAGAKAAGVETGTLLGMVEKFDTFAGAAEGAGKLNSILGSQLSGTEMLMMTEDERLKTLISTTQATGQSFASMDKFTQKAIAGAAGITDMAEANKIFGMSLSEYENYEMQMKQSANTQEKFENALKSMQPFMEKLAALAEQFAGAFLPVLNALIVPLDYLIWAFGGLNERSDGLFGTIVGGLAGFTLFIKGMGGLAKLTGLANLKIVKSIALSIKKYAADQAASVMSFFRRGQVQQEIIQEEVKQQQQKRGIVQQQVANQTASSGVVPMLALAAAIAMIGGGIYLAATGMAEFVKAFAGLTGPQLVAATIGLVAFTIAFAVLMSGLIGLVSGPQALLTAAAIGVLQGIGFAALMIGAGIGLAALGMAEFIKSMAGLEKMAGLMGALSGTADIAVDLVFSQRMGALAEFLDKVDKSDIKAELENIALITTGKSASLMTKSSVTQMQTINSLADQIKNVFNADIVIKIDGDAMDGLIEKGVYKTSMGNK